MAFDFPASPTEGQMFAPSGGPLYVFNSPVWKVAGITTIPGEWKMNVIVLTTGTGPYVKPANLAYLEATVIGAGGGSADIPASLAGNSAAGGGGGGGGVSIKLYKASDLAASTPYVVGASGAKLAGGASTFMGQTGAGGTAGSSSTSGATPGGTGFGTGGAASGGDLDVPGGHGESGVRAAFNATWVQAGAGGASLYAMAQPQRQNTSAITGSYGTFPGGGASGGATAGAQSVQAGGWGAAGCIILREYYPAWVLDAAYAPGTIVETLYTAPSTTWNKPAGLKHLEVVALSGGGGGGAAVATGASQSSVGGGGGSGAIGRKFFDASELPASVSMTVGSGGISQGAGGATSFGALNVSGGNQGGTAPLADSARTSGGLGGIATGWDVNGTGAPGIGGWALSTTANVVLRGTGGSSPYGGGGVGTFGSGGTAGNPASGYGAGGSGAGNAASQGTSQPGGVGTPGLIILKEYY